MATEFGFAVGRNRTSHFGDRLPLFSLCCFAVAPYATAHGMLEVRGIISLALAFSLSLSLRLIFPPDALGFELWFSHETALPQGSESESDDIVLFRL